MVYRALSIIAPKLWNESPLNICSSPSISPLKHSLKTCLYSPTFLENKSDSLLLGIVCGVKGYEEIGGLFYVEDMCFAGLPQAIPSDVVESDK